MKNIPSGEDGVVECDDVLNSQVIKIDHLQKHMYTALWSVQSTAILTKSHNLKRKTVTSQFNTSPDDRVFGMETLATQ